MNVTHSPGPWREGPTDGIGQVGRLRVVDANGVQVADCESPKRADNPLVFVRPMAEDEANVRLVMAAPDLLAIVRLMLAASEDEFFDRLYAVQDDARALIARIEATAPPVVHPNTRYDELRATQETPKPVDEIAVLERIAATTGLTCDQLLGIAPMPHLASAGETPQQDAFRCLARQSDGPTYECDWPICGCDPYAQKVIDALGEAGHLTLKHAESAGETGEREALLSEAEIVTIRRALAFYGHTHGLPLRPTVYINAALALGEKLAALSPAGAITPPASQERAE